MFPFSFQFNSTAFIWTSYPCSLNDCGNFERDDRGECKHEDTKLFNQSPEYTAVNGKQGNFEFVLPGIRVIF